LLSAQWCNISPFQTNKVSEMMRFIDSYITLQYITAHISESMLKKKKRRGCSSGTARLCLRLLALLGWISYNEEVANARAHYNRIIEIFTQSAVPLYCHLIACY